MAEYCEYYLGLSRMYPSNILEEGMYEDEIRKFERPRDKKIAIKTVRDILRLMSDIDLDDCTDEYITRFLLARKYRTNQAAALIAAYQAQRINRQDIFGNLTARDPALQRSLRAGIPGVLPARDRKGRCVLVILASQWDPIAVPAISVQRAIFLVLEILTQDPRNQKSGFVAIVDWSGFSFRQGSALGAAAVRNLITSLRGRFPARFKAIHFLSMPLYIQATLTLVKPFLDEKTRNKIYLHGNNLSTLHEHLPTDILPAELGGTGPAFNPGLWAEPVIHSAMKEAEFAVAAKGDERIDETANVQKLAVDHRDGSEIADGEKSVENEAKPRNDAKTPLDNSDGLARCFTGRTNVDVRADVELDVISSGPSDRKEIAKNEIEDNAKDQLVSVERGHGDASDTCRSDDRTEQLKDTDDSTFFDMESEISAENSNEFEMIPSRSNSESSKDGSLDDRSTKAFIVVSNSEVPSEETNLVT